jgi:hypothetical protein
MGGLVAAAGSFSLGTGAFTSVSAKRKVNVAVADDDEAYLSLNDTSQIARAYSAGKPEQIAFAIPSLQEDTIGDGVGQNSVYVFDDLVEVTNQGENTVLVWSESAPTSGVESVSLTGPESVLDAKEDGIELTPGEAFSAGLLIETSEKTGNFDASVTIRAEKSGIDGFPGPD